MRYLKYMWARLTWYHLIATGLSYAIILLNVHLYWPSSEAYNPLEVGPDTRSQLHFLKQSLLAGAGEEMQAFFPEGYFFSYVLYGLTWVNIGLRTPPERELHQTALAEARWAMAHLDSPTGKTAFSSRLDPPYGVFYVGWRSWLQGGILKLQPSANRNSAEVARFQTDCEALAQAFTTHSSPFLPAYLGQAWPVDSVVAMAALRLHDDLFPPRYEDTIDTWLTQTQALLDAQTGLIPHQVNPTTGMPLQGARGSSQSIIARFLVEIDPTWGRAQYTLFRTQFVDTLLGGPGVKEYPLGVNGQGDVDSGPLIAGFSASASVVILGAARVHNDHLLADPLLHISEGFGLPLTLGRSKRYAFGLMPVGDAFLVWAKNARFWLTEPPETVTFAPVVYPAWRLPWQGVGLLLLGVVWWPVLRRRK